MSLLLLLNGGSSTSSSVRVTQAAVEAMVANPSSGTVRVSQLAVEVMLGAPQPVIGETHAWPTVKVEFGFGHGLNDTAITWVDATAIDGLSLTSGGTTRGRIYGYGPTSGEGVLRFHDPHGVLDPTNAASPYDGDIVPMTPVRVTATWAGVDYPRLTGFVESWTVLNDGPFDQTVEVHIVDKRKAVNLVGLPSSVFAVEMIDTHPDHWYRLNEPASATVAIDAIGHADGTYDGGTRQQEGAIFGDDDTSVFFAQRHFPEYDRNENVLLPIAVNGTEDFTIAVAYNVPVSPVTRGTGPQGDVFIQRKITGVNRWSINVDKYLETDGLSRGLVSFAMSYGTSPGNNYGIATYSIPDVGDHVDPPEIAVGWHILIARRVGLGLYLNIDGVDYAVPNGTTPGSVVNLAPNEIYISGPMGVDEFALWHRAISDTEVARLQSAARTPWADDRAGSRIGRLLGVAGITDTSALDTGISRFQPATKLEGTTVMDQIDRCAAADDGRFFFAKDGTPTYQDRHVTLAAAPAFTFGPDDGQIHYRLEETPRAIDDREVINLSRVTRTGGATQQAEDLTSQARYGIRTSDPQRTDFDLVDDAESKARAEWEVAQHKTPLPHPAAITVLPSNTNPATHYPACLGAELGDRVVFAARSMGAATPWTDDQVIEQITDAFQADGEGGLMWKTVFGPVAITKVGYWRWGVSKWGDATQATGMTWAY